MLSAGLALDARAQTDWWTPVDGPYGGTTVWDLQRLNDLLQDPQSDSARVFGELKRRLRIRRCHPAFHPDSDQQTLDLGNRVFALWRLARYQRVLIINNVTDVNAFLHIGGA